MAKRALRRPALPPGARLDLFLLLQDLVLRAGDPSTVELGTKIHVSHQTVWKALTGPRIPGRQIVKALVDCLLELLPDPPADLVDQALRMWADAVAEERGAQASAPGLPESHSEPVSDVGRKPLPQARPTPQPWQRAEASSATVVGPGGGAQSLSSPTAEFVERGAQASAPGLPESHSEPVSDVGRKPLPQARPTPQPRQRAEASSATVVGPGGGAQSLSSPTAEFVERGGAARRYSQPDPRKIATEQDFGEALTALRMASGSTIRQIAELTRIPTSTLGAYFAGTRVPAVDQQDRIGAILRTVGVTDSIVVEQWHDALARVRETRHLDRSPVLGGLEALLRETDFAWSLDLIGEDQAGKLATLTGDLRRGFSMTGDGKRIASGFSYLGTEPAIAWANACRDRLFPVMKQGIESFGLRWRGIRESLDGKPYNYVSLGPGDGQKDEVILQDLRRDNAQLCYVAVDPSAEMLRLGVPALIRELKLSRSRALAVQLDYSSKSNVAELRRVLDVLFGEEAVLFSLLGNTMTNFENDTELLGMLTGQLLRPQDRFVLEVATTRQLDDTLAQEAAEEYGRSRTFREFITSAFMHYTDLHIDMDSVLFQGSIEEEQALLVKIIYQNRTGRDVRITLPDRTDVSFPQQDTVRLGLSRKYMRDHLESLLVESGVHMLASSHFDFGGGTHSGLGFGMALLVLTAGSETAGQEWNRNLAKNLWIR